MGTVTAHLSPCPLIGGGWLLVGSDSSLYLVENSAKGCCGGKTEVAKVLIYIIKMEGRRKAQAKTLGAERKEWERERKTGRVG